MVYFWDNETGWTKIAADYYCY